MTDLVRHVAQVYEHKIACTTLGHEPDPWPPVWQVRDPVDWLSDAHARLLAMFARSEPTTPSYTWWPPDQTVGFWARRMAHETAVHRFDAELAAGTPTSINADLAADGVDEILGVMLEGDWSDEPVDTATGARVAVSTSGRTWTVAMERESVSAPTPVTCVPPLKPLTSTSLRPYKAKVGGSSPSAPTREFARLTVNGSRTSTSALGIRRYEKPRSPTFSRDRSRNFVSD